jgi:hypothetical protein
MTENTEARTPGREFVSATEEGLSGCIKTGRAACSFAREAYDRVHVHVVTTSRKRWGRLFELVLTGWDAAADMTEALATIDGLINELVASAERLKPTNGVGLVCISSGVTLVAILRGAVVRRIGELAESAESAERQPAEPASEGECVGGGGATAA